MVLTTPQKKKTTAIVYTYIVRNAFAIQTDNAMRKDTHNQTK